MALTDAEKLSVRLALKEPLEAQTRIDTQIGLLNSAAETRIKALIVEFDKLYIDPTRMKISGVEIDNGAQLALVCESIAVILGWVVEDPGTVLIGRGYIEDFHTGQSLDRFNYDNEW